MKRVGFAYNPTNAISLELRGRATAWCGRQRVESWYAPAVDTGALVANLPGTDALVVLGGDGTFLRAARAIARVDVPILGINGGRVGFLSKAESDHLEAVLGQLEAGEFDLESRMMLDVRVLPGGSDETEAPVGVEGEERHGKGRGAADGGAAEANEAQGEPGRLRIEGEPHVALNEAAIVRGATARVVRLDLQVDDSHVATYIADGIVVASPTGSTGYSSSAGGPILDPTARNLVVTPIAAYMAPIRSIVVGPNDTVTVTVIDAADCLVSIDGRDESPLNIGDAVLVRAAERPIRFIQPTNAMPFWQVLRRKAEQLPR